MSETLKDLLEYLQNKIDSGEHKIFYNDLGWDIKTIDCINAINEQQEEIERLNKKIEQYENPEDMTLMFMWCDEKAKDEIKRLNNIIKEVREYITYWHYRNDFRINSFTTGVKEELLEILDKVGDKE